MNDMSIINRRKFIYSTAMIATINGVISSCGNNAAGKSERTSKNILTGIISAANNPEEDLKIVRDLGFPTCQLRVKDFSPELAVRVSASLDKYSLKPTALLCSGPGIYKYNFADGPSTCGLVPRENRAARVERLKQACDFCKAAGIPAVLSHFGFIPENPRDVLYIEFVDTMKSFAEYALKQGIDIYFETGTDTPVTLVRAIQDIGTGNLFANYDTANMVLYGNANPLDGLKVLGKYVKALHAKDGTYPTNPYELGKEVPIPTGEVNFPAIISFLKKMDFHGNITIECELAGRNNEYILKTKEYLEKIILD
jgi:L-ribulose-5-phosphate 3-epimerase